MHPVQQSRAERTARRQHARRAPAAPPRERRHPQRAFRDEAVEGILARGRCRPLRGREPPRARRPGPKIAAAAVVVQHAHDVGRPAARAASLGQRERVGKASSPTKRCGQYSPCSRPATLSATA